MIFDLIDIVQNSKVFEMFLYMWFTDGLCIESGQPKPIVWWSRVLRYEMLSMHFITGMHLST